ncbi:hypothetical protein BX261_7296 [Streptomyces sp. 2321.6]|uniref:hypothetical protein n=1 Tax=Streptomyces sp. 2321.6 TaxID=1938840 RepID=UPI000BB11DB9|nr:hypothetical protein [Streptomyces sp. 2321.6]PBC72361.1 hypothetical protein BX261_7233 [Streptomyces sp. 2321.6]PBC72422.1 hypothetical protein BX261_7296 [Streptomyces sp. 2321.6]
MSRLTLEGLEDQLDELVMLVSAVADDSQERTDRLDKAVGKLREQLQELIAHVAAAEAQDAGEEDEPPQPASWVERATPEEWADLADWVDWLQGHYEVSGEYRLPPCWPRHKGAAEELHGLHGSWQAAMLADMKAEGVGDAAVYWHDRYRLEALRRACSSVNRSCFNGNHIDPKPVPATDRNTLPAVADPPTCSTSDEPVQDPE